MQELDLNGKIIYLYYLIYQISEKEKDSILSLLEFIKDEEKEKIIIILYNRYKDRIINMKGFLNSIEIANNTIDEGIEKNKLEEINFNI